MEALGAEAAANTLVIAKAGTGRSCVNCSRVSGGGVGIIYRHRRTASTN
jgi:hypothetical protein